jgi:hypothetical protein
MKSYCQIPEVIVGDTDAVGFAVSPFPPNFCSSLWGPPSFEMVNNINENFSYTILPSKPDDYQRTATVLFSPKKIGVEIDSASFITVWGCGYPRNLYVTADSSVYFFIVQGIDSVVTIKTKDKTIIVPIDTINRKYKGEAIPFYFYSNIADSVLFDDWKVDVDAASGITFSIDSGGGTIFEYSSQPFTRKKQLNFTFSTDLIPTDSAKTFQAIMKTRVRHGIVDSIYSTPLVFIFPPAPKSDVKRGTENDIEFSIYPNPSSGIVTLRLSDVLAGPITIEIFDLLGNKKAVVAENVYVAGEKYLVFDTRILPNGEYFVRASNERKVLTRKLLVE